MTADRWNEQRMRGVPEGEQPPDTQPAVKPAEVLVEFYAYETVGCTIHNDRQYESLSSIIIDPETHKPVTTLAVGQNVLAGSWKFTITEVDSTRALGESAHLHMFGVRRDNGTWDAAFISKTVKAKLVMPPIGTES